MTSLLNRFVCEDAGQDLIEYVLLASFVSIGAAGGATLVGVNLDTWYSAIGGWAASQVGKF